MAKERRHLSPLLPHTAVLAWPRWAISELEVTLQGHNKEGTAARALPLDRRRQRHGRFALGSGRGAAADYGQHRLHIFIVYPHEQGGIALAPEPARRGQTSGAETCGQQGIRDVVGGLISDYSHYE